MKYKLGLDIHGVIDANPGFFAEMSRMLVSVGQEVHILTGQKDDPGLRARIAGYGVQFTHFFSITSYHESHGTKIWYDGKGRPWMDAEIWNRTKAEYCLRNSITLHIDDSPIYGQYFTGTIYLLYKKTDVAIS